MAVRCMVLLGFAGQSRFAKVSLGTVARGEDGQSRRVM